jgi:methionyl-tRNA formyltransferase
VRIVFAGTPSTAATVLRALKAASFDIALVITRPDAPLGRKQVVTESPVAIEARQLGLEVLKTSVINDEANQEIAKVNADIGVVVAYGSFLSDQTLSLLSNGWVNLHFSLLPKYRGAAPVQHAILNGERVTGVSVFQIDSSMDGGKVYLQVPTNIEPSETTGRLLERLTTLGISALTEVLPQIFSGIAKSEVQNDSEKSFAPKISRENARVNWSRSATEAESLIFSMNPEPMAWTEFQGTTLRILSGLAAKTDDSFQEEVGKVSLVQDRVQVQCGGASSLVLLEIQPAGKRIMSASDWYRGLADPLGVKLE